MIPTNTTIEACIIAAHQAIDLAWCGDWNDPQRSILIAAITAHLTCLKLAAAPNPVGFVHFKAPNPNIEFINAVVDEYEKGPQT